MRCDNGCARVPSRLMVAYRGQRKVGDLKVCTPCTPRVEKCMFKAGATRLAIMPLSGRR